MRTEVVKDIETTLATFRHYVDRIDAVLDKLTDHPEAAEILDSKLAADMFSTGQQFAVALNVAARGVYQVAGRALPEFPERFDLATLREFAAELRQGLAGISVADLSEARVRHVAGFAELEQEALDFMIRFALPNMMFHFGMGYAGLRAAGVPLGKADFDGLHIYPEGFSF